MSSRRIFIDRTMDASDPLVTAFVSTYASENFKRAAGALILNQPWAEIIVITDRKGRGIIVNIRRTTLKVISRH